MSPTGRYAIENAEVAGRRCLLLSDRDREVEATVVPELAMLVWSLRIAGTEVLAQPNPLDAFASSWATTGIPLLYPWANRLDGDRLGEANCPALRRDDVPRDGNDLPIHGLNLSGPWSVRTRHDGSSVAADATLPFDGRRLEVFPYPHRVGVTVTLVDGELVIDTRIEATSGSVVPVSFGWHPYFAIPGVPRRDWLVRLPVRTRAELDARMIPTGAVAPVAIPTGLLGDAVYDDLFPGLEVDPVFRLEANGLGVEVTLGDGYPHAQVYAPAERELIAFEPMTAQTNALNRPDVRVVLPGERFVATFRVRPFGLA